MTKDRSSLDSMAEASRDHAVRSGHGQARGAAGYRPGEGEHAEERLCGFGETVFISAPAGGFGDIRVGAEWDNIKTKATGDKKDFFKRFFHKVTFQGVDIDLGCLYELKDGTRGALQAFGDKFGSFEEAPFVKLSGDERTGNAKGLDEAMHINGTHWGEIRRLLFYVYIYSGVPDWGVLQPKIHLHIPGEQPYLIVPKVKKTDLAVCAVAGLENAKGGMMLSNYGEYFPGHAEMDRAYGYGLQWDDGHK